MREFYFRFLELFGLRPTWRSEAVEELPEKLVHGRIYLVGDERNPWSASFTCPCGCKAPISISLIHDDQPSWTVKYHTSEEITFHPSIWRNKGCKSHFFVRYGKIVWSRAS
jgi:Family of unknown function (DUF6527)